MKRDLTIALIFASIGYTANSLGRKILRAHEAYQKDKQFDEQFELLNELGKQREELGIFTEEAQKIGEQMDDILAQLKELQDEDSLTH